MNLWFTFFSLRVLLFDLALNVHASFVIHLQWSMGQNKSNWFLSDAQAWWITTHKKDSMHSNYFVHFSPSLQCWFFGFCSSQDLLYRQVVNLSLFVWLILVFCSFFRFATDSVCTMRFLFRMVFVCVTAIGFDFWGCLKHMDHRYVHLWVSFYGFICFCLGFLFMVH